MAKFNKTQVIRKYNFLGKDYIDTAEIIFLKNISLSASGLLLYHGIELLFKSYILINSDETEQTIKKYKHNLVKLYNKCVKLDGDKFDKEQKLKFFLYFLINNYAIDNIKIRYPTESSFKRFPRDIFEIIEETLSGPLETLVRKTNNN
jgi:hypothetical protein